MNSSIHDLEHQIEETEASISQTSESINQKTIELSDRKAMLAEAIRVMYETQASDSIFFSLIGEDSLSDAATKVEYLEAPQQRIEDGIDRTTVIRADLETQKQTLENLQQENERQQQGLAEQRTQKDRLRDNEAVELTVLNKQIAADRARLAQVEAQLAQEIAALWRNR